MVITGRRNLKKMNNKYIFLQVHFITIDVDLFENKTCMTSLHLSEVTGQDLASDFKKERNVNKIFAICKSSRG
jgi:hypothetical protein